MTAQTPESESRYAVRDEAPRRWRDLFLNWDAILLILLVAVVVVNTLASPYFLDIYNLADASFNFSEKAIIALGMALLILVRDIDLSVAAIVALASMGIGYAAEAGYGPGVLFLVAIAIGLACGAFNGLLVIRVGLPAIVVTIGTMSLFRGITQVILGDQAKTKYPSAFLDLGQSYFIQMKETGIPYLVIPPLPLSFLIFLVLAVIFGVVLHRTATGRRLFAIGWELDIVTVVVLGGVSIAGGVGSIIGVVLAVFVLGLFTFGMSLNNVPGQVVSVYIGALLIAVIAIPRIADMLRRRGFGSD